MSFSEHNEDVNIAESANGKPSPFEGDHEGSNPSSAVNDTVSSFKGGLVPSDTPIPEYDNQRFISSAEYAGKYGLSRYEIAPACRAWHKNPDIPPTERSGLISEKRLVAEVASVSKGKVSNYKDRKRWQWFVLDIPPSEHHGWEKHQATILKGLEKEGRYQAENFDRYAPQYLERFIEAKNERLKNGIGDSDYKLQEITEILHTNNKVITYWSEVGVDGYGRLPRVKVPEQKNSVKTSDGNYRSVAGRLEYVYREEDIVRFLTKQYADPKKVFHSVSDAFAETTIDEIAAKEGYFVYDPTKVYPMTYEGFLKWLDDNVMVYDYELDKTVKIVPNIKQKEFFASAFKKNVKGHLFYKMLCISRPRAEFKTTDVCLVVLFHFFNRPKQSIYLIACNSEFQSEQLLMGEIKNIINYSPNLKGLKYIQVLDAEINLLSGNKEVYSFIKTASIRSGTLSNASIFVFTEFFELKERKQFAKLEGSTRARPNAFTMCEGIASSEGHVWHEFYQAASNTPDVGVEKDKLMHFQWYGDEWFNPKNTPEERSHFKVTHGEAEYNKHFRNLWGSGTTEFYTRKAIIEMGLCGVDNIIGPSKELTNAVNGLIEAEDGIAKFAGTSVVDTYLRQKASIISRLKFMDDIYKIPATTTDIERLREVFGLDYFYLGIGIDRASKVGRRSDRSIVVATARAPIDEYNNMYFVLDVFFAEDHSQEVIKRRIEWYMENLGQIGFLNVEEYQGKDIVEWALGPERGIPTKSVPGSFKQKDILLPQTYSIAEAGLLKSPTVPLWFDETNRVYTTLPPDGTDDILRAEMKAYIYIPQEDTGIQVGYYGSKFKNNKSKRTKLGEPKDDSVEAMALSMDAAKQATLELVSLSGELLGMDVYKNEDVVGRY